MVHPQFCVLFGFLFSDRLPYDQKTTSGGASKDRVLPSWGQGSRGFCRTWQNDIFTVYLQIWMYLKMRVCLIGQNRWWNLKRLPSSEQGNPHKRRNSGCPWEFRVARSLWSPEITKSVRWVVFSVECHILFGIAGKVDWSISKFLETYFLKRSDPGNLEWNQHIRSGRSCWWMCDAVDSMWLIGADGTGDASSICFYGLLFERWPQLFDDHLWFGCFKEDSWNKSWDSKHPLIHPSNNRCPTARPVSLDLSSRIRSKAPWNSMHCAELDLPWRNILMPRRRRRCAAVWLIPLKFFFFFQRWAEYWHMI